MNKRVAIIGTRGYPSYYGGFETAVRRLAPYLADQGWDVTVYGRRGAVKEDDPDTDSRIRCVTLKGVELKSFSTLSYGFTAAVHAMIHRPDVALVMNCANGFWLPMLKFRGIPSVVNVDGMEWERDKWGRVAKGVFKCGALMTAKYADVIISDARAIAGHWQAKFARDSVFIPYGGDTPDALPVPEGLPKGGYILVVARLVPENSIPEFFRAVRKLDGKYPVVIVGSTGYGGGLDSDARELAAVYSNVKWLGQVSDDAKLNALWQHAGAYFHGHSVGGTNPALVQAMACGTPIVARDTPYNREVLGDHGSFVLPDPDRIAQALSQKVDEVSRGAFDRQPLLDRAHDFYSWQGVCSDYEVLLSRVAVQTFNVSKHL